jgi:cardiolipin synthase (CMP-forming)
VKTKVKLLIPNLLTFSRFPAAWFVFRFAANGLWLNAFLLIIYCFLSDAADGLLARKFGVTTRIGHIADMTTDVLVDVAMIVGLCVNNIVPIPVAIPLILAATFIRFQAIMNAPPMSLAARIAAKIMLIYSPTMVLWIAVTYTIKALGIDSTLILATIAIPICVALYLLEKAKIDLWLQQITRKGGSE